MKLVRGDVYKFAQFARSNFVPSLPKFARNLMKLVCMVHLFFHGAFRAMIIFYELRLGPKWNFEDVPF